VKPIFKIVRAVRPLLFLLLFLVAGGARAASVIGTANSYGGFGLTNSRSTVWSAISGVGRWYAAYNDGTAWKWATSTDGTTWTVQGTIPGLAAGTGTQTAGSLTRDTAGNLYLNAQGNGTNNFSLYTAAGWIAAPVATDGSGVNGGQPLVYESGGTTTLRLIFPEGGGTAGRIQYITNPSATNTTLAPDYSFNSTSNGAGMAVNGIAADVVGTNVIAVMLNGNGGELEYLTMPGGTVGANVQIHGTAIITAAGITNEITSCKDSAGNMHVLYHVAGTGWSETVFNGTSWTAGTLITALTNNDATPSLMSDSAGAVELVYAKYNAANDYGIGRLTRAAGAAAGGYTAQTDLVTHDGTNRTSVSISKADNGTQSLVTWVSGAGTYSLVGQAFTTSAAVAATTLSVSPTSGSGNTGAASAPFTVSLNGYLSSNSVITVTDDLAQAVATLTFAPNGTATPASQTFTYTPGATGSRTLTFAHTGQAGIANPAAITYASSVAAPTFAAKLPAILYSGGLWVDAEYNAHFARMPMGIGSQVDFRATGTALTALLYMPTSVSVQAKIDSGAWTTLTGNASAWANYTLFTGLTDTAHDVSLRLVSGTAYQFALDEAAFVSLSGSAPAVSAPNPSSWVTSHLVGSGLLNGFAGQMEGVWTSGSDFTNGYSRLPVYTSSGGTGSALRFKAKCTSIKAFGPTSGLGSVTIMVRVDGVDQGALSTPVLDTGTTGPYAWATVAAGLDGTATHEYVLTAIASSWNVLSIECPSTLGDGLSLAALPARPALAVYGDSITFGAGATTPTKAWAYLLAKSKGMALFDYGYTGYQVMSDTANFNALSTAYGNSLNNVPKPATLVYMGGVNDQVSTGASVPVADFVEADRRLVEQLASSFPGTQVLYLGLLPNAGANVANRPAMNTGKSANAAALGYANLTYVNTDGWITGTDTSAGGDMNDGLHPNNVGHLKVATQLVPLVALPPGVTPLSLTITGTGNTRTLNWTPDPQATSYKVYRGGTADTLALIATVATGTTTYTDTARPAGNVYYSIISLH